MTPSPTCRSASPRLWLAAATFSAIVSGCGGDGGSDPTPPETTLQSVSVQVSTAGEDLDTDGYTLELGSRSRSVSTAGSVTFEDVPPGTHQVRISGVAANCTVTGGDTRSVTVGPDSGASARFDVMCQRDFGDGLTTVACPALAPLTASGLPMDSVSIGRLPATFAPPLYARVLTGGGTESVAFLTTDEAGDSRLVVPVHPTANAAGGSVEIRVTDGVSACATFAFGIETLPSAEGELTAIVDLLQAIITEQAALLDTSPQGLLDTPPEELPTALIPLALVQSVIDDPRNERSLRAYADGAAPARLDLLEPLLARTDLREALEASVGVESSPSSPPSRLSARLCTPGAVGNDPGLLDACMETQASAAFELEHASGKVLKDLGNLFGVLAFIPGLGELTAVGGAVSWAAINAKARTSALLPSKLTSMTLDAAPTFFLEDQPGPGSWSASVTAANEGWDLGKEAIEAILQAAGVAGVFDKTGLSDLPLLETLAGVAAGPIAEALIGDGTLEEWKIPVETFGPVLVSDPMWSEVEIHGSAASLSIHGEYEPEEPGTAILAVRTKTGEFAGKQIAEQDEIVVDALSLSITPADIVVPPGDPMDLVFWPFVVHVEDAKNPDMVDLDLTEHPKQGDAEIEIAPGSDTHRVDYVAPVSPNFGEADLIVVRHTSTAGARDGGVERTAIATVRFGSLTIMPRFACLEPADTLALSAEVEGPDDDDLVWDADVGTVDDSGLYTAPSELPEGGEATITAHLEAYPLLRDEVTVSIGGCTCGFTLSVGGSTLQGQPGDRVAFTDAPPLAGGNHQLVSVHVESPLGTETVLIPTDGSFTEVEDLPLLPGVYPGVAGGGVGFSGFYGSDGNVGVFELLEYEPQRRASGTMTGVVVELGEPENTMILHVEFSISLAADYTPLGARYTCVIPDGG